jgi:putative transcriptional regulator
MTRAPHVVAELPQFIRDAEALQLLDDERQAIVNAVASNPLQGDEIRGSGGVRKVRFSGRGKGKSGGYRVVTAYFGPNAPVYLVALLSKGERGNFSAAEIAGFKQLTGQHRAVLEEKRMSKAAERIMQGLREAAGHARGEEVPGIKVHVPPRIDVTAIRRKTGLSQEAFSARIGVSTGTLRNWEQGRRTPDGPARVLLAMLARNPRVVEDTLGKGRNMR